MSLPDSRPAVAEIAAEFGPQIASADEAKRLERVARLLATIIWGNMIYRWADNAETGDQERDRNASNEHEHERWNKIVDGLIDGRITAEMLAGFNCNSPMARAALLEALETKTRR